MRTTPHTHYTVHRLLEGQEAHRSTAGLSRRRRQNGEMQRASLCFVVTVMVVYGGNGGFKLSSISFLGSVHRFPLFEAVTCAPIPCNCIRRCTLVKHHSALLSTASWFIQTLEHKLGAHAQYTRSQDTRGSAEYGSHRNIGSLFM